MIPAHIWTPWFSLFGGRSGFNSIEECFGDLSKHIVALETGLSADPKMIRLVSELDRFALISNSDSHSPSNIGREATIFNAKFDYFGIRDSLINNSVRQTIEFFPEEGKYFASGHRNCGYYLDPKTGSKGFCPICDKPLTQGVMNRVNELADRTIVPSTKQARFISTISLPDIISQVVKVGPKSKRVMRQYQKLINIFGSEFRILFDQSIDDISNRYSPLIGKAIDNVRNGRVQIIPGFDGEYGKILLPE